MTDNPFLNLVTIGDGSAVANRLFNDGVYGTFRVRDDNLQDLTLQGLEWTVLSAPPHAPRSSKGDIFGNFGISGTGPSASWSYELTGDDRDTLTALDFDFVPAKPDTVTLGADEELTLTSKTPGASAEAGDDIPQIRARLVIDNDNAAQPSIVIDPPNSASGPDEVDITITVAAGTTWRQVSNFINTGNLLGGSGTSAATEYVTAEVRVPSERVEAEDSTGAGLKFDRALLADADGINQILLTARKPGDGRSDSTDLIPEITFTLTQSANARGSGFGFNDNRNDGTLAITYNAGSEETWAQIVEAINGFNDRPSSRQASSYISATLVGADGGSVAEPIAEVELTGALGVPDELVVVPFGFDKHFDKDGGHIQMTFSSLLEPGDDRDIKVTLDWGITGIDINVTENNSEINITIMYGGNTTTWIKLAKAIEEHSDASKYVVASLPYTVDPASGFRALFLSGNNEVNVFSGNDRDVPITGPLAGGMDATGDNSLPVFETLTGGADEVPPGDLTFTYTIRAEETGGTTHDQDVTIVFSAENNAPDLQHLGTTENVVMEEGAGNTASAMLEFRDPNHFEDGNASLNIAASFTESGLTGDEAPTTGRIGGASVTYTGVYGDFTLTRNNNDAINTGTPGQIGWTYRVDEGRANSLHKYREENGEAVAGTFGTDTLYVRVWDDEGDSSEIRAVEVEVRGVNDVPTVTTSFIAVNRDDTDSITLTDENINFTDLDASEDPANIIYTIKTAAPGAGLERNNVPLSAGGTFTHQDILDGWVTLTISNANTLSGLRLSVTDGKDANPAEVLLSVQARGVSSIARPDEVADSVDHSRSGGNLVIDTGDYNDQIKAAQGSDFITGGLGDDTINLTPRAGDETGQDTVVYNFGSGSIFTATDGGDDITGFKRGEDIFLLKTESDNPELATLDGLLSYVSGSDRESSHDDVMIVTPNFVFGPEDGGSNIVVTGITGITLHFEDAGIYGNGYLAKGYVSITFDEQLDWAEFLSLIEIDNGTIDENFNYSRGLIRDLSVLPNLMGEGSLAYERQGAVLPIEIAPSGVRSVEETPPGTLTQARTDVTYFVLDGVATGNLELARVDSGDPNPTGFFGLDGNVLYLKSGISLDYDSGVRTLNVRVQDMNDSTVGVDVKVKVTNVNDVAPAIISDTLVEFDRNTAVVYDAAAIFDRTRVVWSLKEEDDHELLDIDIDTGEVSFKQGTTHPEEDTTYSFTVVATSGALASVEQEVAIYPTGYVAPVIAAMTGRIQDGDANSANNTPDAVSGEFMATSGLDIEWEAVLRPGTTRYGTIDVVGSQWTFRLNNTGRDEINSLNAGETTQAVFDVTATNVVGPSNKATLTIDLQGYSPTGAPVFRNDDVDVTIVVDGDASGQIGFTGDDNGTAFAADIITPIGRHDTGSYRAVANADGSTNIEGTYGILTLNHDGSWTYALDHDNTHTIALSMMPLPVDPVTNRKLPIERTETFSLGYRSVDGGNAVDEVANIDITVTNPGEINTTNNFTSGVAFGFLPASGQVGARRGNMFLDFDSFTIGIGNTRQRAIDNLDNRIAGDDVRQVVEIRLILNFNDNTQMPHEDLEDPGVLQREQIYGIFRFDFRDGSWTYTITEPQAGRDSEARNIIDTSGSGRHDHGDNLAIPVYIAVQDITGARLPTLADGSHNADISSISLRGADVIKADGNGRAQGTNKNEFLQGRPSVTDNINTGEGYNGVFAGGGADNITLGNGMTFHTDRKIAVLDAQVDVVYHRVHFDDGDVVVERPWRNTNNVDGNDIINNFIRNEDQFIFVEWTRTRTAEQPNHEGVKLSEEQFLSNNALVLLTADIESVGNVFTLAGFKIGFARNGSDAITFNYHNKSKVALTTDGGSLTTDDILAKYGLASTVRDGKHVIADNQQITGTEVRHNYFGDTNEDSFQIIHAIPTAITEI